jgi:hypothetical protein
MKNLFCAFLIALSIFSDSYSEEMEKPSLEKIEIEQLLINQNGLFYVDEANNVFGVEAVYNIKGALYLTSSSL